MTRDQWLGIGLLILLHLMLQLPLAVYTKGASLPFAGFSQVIYLLPAIVIADTRGKSALASGLTICGALTFLLVSSCAALGYVFGPHTRSGHF